MIDLLALWKKEGKNGPYLSGKLGNNTVMVFPNKNKKTDKHPDYRVVIAPPMKKEEPKNYAPSMDSEQELF